ncbi:MAG: hypothetical protein V1745_02490 [Patescibacteria group bacterium]
MHTTKYLMFIAMAASLFGFGCTTGSNKIVSNEKIYEPREINDLMATTTEMALANGDFTICATLPVRASYQNGDMEQGSLVRYVITPRPRCYWEFVLKTKQPMACDALEELKDNGFRSGSQCYEYLAQATNDISLCGKMTVHEPLCRAKLSKSIEPCYEMQKDEHDVSKYSRSVQFCIGSVALRLRSYEPCLKIDGPDYGEQWRVGRNECLRNVASLLKPQSNELAAVCEKMVDDEKMWDIKAECLSGHVVSDIEQQIPPIGYGVGSGF